mgnify:CR=1 FL=1
MNNPFDLKDKVIILTGSSGLLGLQYAEGLAHAGANLVLVDNNIKKSKLVINKISQKYENESIIINTNLTDKDSIKKMVSQTLKKFSKIDVLINNAAFSEGPNERNTPFEQFSLKSWNNVISVNLTGTMMCCQEIGKVMKNKHSGSIINISSIYGLLGADQRIYGNSGLNSSIAYATTKAAIINMTRYLASYWHNTGIRINTLSLGGVKNFQDPKFIRNYSKNTMLGRMAKKDEYVGALIFLSSNASSYMTGSNLVVDGGWTAW